MICTLYKNAGLIFCKNNTRVGRKWLMHEPTLVSRISHCEHNKHLQKYRKTINQISLKNMMDNYATFYICIVSFLKTKN